MYVFCRRRLFSSKIFKQTGNTFKTLEICKGQLISTDSHEFRLTPTN